MVKADSGLEADQWMEEREKPATTTNGKLLFLSKCPVHVAGPLKMGNSPYSSLGSCPLMLLSYWGGKWALNHLPASISRGPEAGSETENSQGRGTKISL